MNRSSFALFVALLIHLIFLLIFWILGTITIPPKHQTQPKEKKIKISLKEMPKVQKKAEVIKKKVEPSVIAKPMPKGSQLKKLIKKPLIKHMPKKVKKTILNKQTIKPKPKIEPLPPKKPYIPLIQQKKEPLKKQAPLVKNENNITKEIKEVPKKNILKKEKIIEKKKEPADPLYALLSQDKSDQEDVKKEHKSSERSSINQDIKELYGDKFGELTKGQQEYILDNQEIMRRITQQVLNRVARVNLPRDLNVNKSNIIEFYLHPNGDMSDFRFLKKSGYYVLDDTTKETIEYAYSKYPKPKEKTLIRYNVFYNLAKY